MNNNYYNNMNNCYRYNYSCYKKQNQYSNYCQVQDKNDTCDCASTSNCCQNTDYNCPSKQNCCPTTVTVGRTITGEPGTQANVYNTGTNTNAILNFVIPRGEDGMDGTSAKVNVGATITGEPGSTASVTNSGTSTNAVLNFVIPRGETGLQGPQGIPGENGEAGTITIGTTITGEPGTDASVTNTGTVTNAILNFTIPRGQDGVQGPVGPQGPIGPQGEQGIAGEDGITPTITIGTTTTGEAGTNAAVTNTGTDTDLVLNFTIPRGEAGTITPGVAVTTLEATATLTETIAKINELITSLTNAGFLAA